MEPFGEKIHIFQDYAVPRDCQPAGYAYLAQALNIPAPIRRPSAISAQHIKHGIRQEGEKNSPV